MKKIVFISIILCAANVFGNAQQNRFKQELSFGASFGMGISTVSFVPKVQQKQLTGYHFGGTLRWITEKNLGLQAEVNYSQQGWSELFDDAKYSYIRRLHFLDIPVLTHIYFGNKQVRFFVNLGPKIGFLLNEKTTENVIASPPPVTQPAYTSEQWNMPVEKSFAWGLCGGPGIELRTAIGILQLEGRYYYALGDLFGNRKADYFPQSSSQVIYGKLTWLIPFL
ncbi:MAG: PorT family protein [Tannerellaceae bacterium]|nr:PorT family protein [Tannerellaceae bacterium]